MNDDEPPERLPIREIPLVSVEYAATSQESAADFASQNTDFPYQSKPISKKAGSKPIHLFLEQSTFLSASEIEKQMSVNLGSKRSLTPELRHDFLPQMKNIKKASWRNLVGSTTFTLSRNIANIIPCERLYLKFEGNNPSGTQKDRIAMKLCEEAKNLGFQSITTATCGNFGSALAIAAAHFDIDTYIFIPSGYHVPKDRLKMMTGPKTKIEYVGGQYEDAVYYSSDLSKEHNWYNANPGMNGSTEVSMDGYSEISFEIFRALRRSPEYIVCPVGNGTTIAGIHFGFKKLLAAKKISALPRLIATSTVRGNPIVKSWKLKSAKVIDLKPDEIRETKTNEPLVNWHSFDGQLALDAIYESKGFADYASDGKMQEYSTLLRQIEGLNVLPASASTLAVLNGLTKNGVPLKGTFVAILTGRES